MIFNHKHNLFFSKSIISSMQLCFNSSSSIWSGVPLGPPDAILGLNEAFKASKNPKKVNLGVGAYRDDNGKPVVLNCVKKAEQLMMNNFNDKEYLPIVGLSSFLKETTKLAYGKNNSLIAKNQIAVTQTLSGTGALRIGGEFLAKHFPHHSKRILVPSPTWGNHIPIFKNSGLLTETYRYYDKKNISLDLDGMISDLKAAPKGSVVLLHACAHNPTGVDPTIEQWDLIGKTVKECSHFPFFDMAYQGFASGSPDKDAAAVRHFIEKLEIPTLMLAQSYAKNMGLYGERVGALSITTTSAEERERIESQLKIVIRPSYSNPPIHGARIVSTILSNESLNAEWLHEVKTMADRIISMRHALKEGIISAGSKHSWDHVTDQIGMFCYTGLSEEQVGKLTNEFAIFLTKDGRISMAGVNQSNIEYLSNAIHKVSQ